MRAIYDKEVDVLTITLSEGKPDHGEEVGEGIIVHYAKNNTPVEIEILKAKKYLVNWIGQALDVKEGKSLCA